MTVYVLKAGVVINPEDVLAADWDFTLVESDHLPESGQPLLARAGKWIDAGGQEVYIDDNANVVEGAEAVLKSLNIEIAPEDDDADATLERLHRVF